jgi:arginase
MSECTLVPPVLAAVRERHPDVALVWIDAHGDLNTPETTPSGFIGGMPFAELLGWCFDDWRRLAGLEPAFPEERAVLVGGRDLDPGERENVDRSRLHESDDALGALAALPADAPLYVHVDTDVLDPSLTPDAGFPAPGGWSVERMRSEVSALGATGRVVALSICPSAPPALDAEGLAPLVEALR